MSWPGVAFSPSFSSSGAASPCHHVDLTVPTCTDDSDRCVSDTSTTSSLCSLNGDGSCKWLNGGVSACCRPAWTHVAALLWLWPPALWRGGSVILLSPSPTVRCNQLRSCCEEEDGGIGHVGVRRSPVSDEQEREREQEGRHDGGVGGPTGHEHEVRTWHR